MSEHEALIKCERQLELAERKITLLQQREREIYARLDLIMKYIQPRTVVAQMYREDAPDA